jgi:hypothetical protein
VKIDLHGYHPRTIRDDGLLLTLVQQAWECGADEVEFIHGHGRNRGLTPGFVNTNTGYLGLEVRRLLRHDLDMRQWIYYTTIARSDPGVTYVRLKPNPNPTRQQLDLPEPDFTR